MTISDERLADVSVANLTVEQAAREALAHVEDGDTYGASAKNPTTIRTRQLLEKLAHDALRTTADTEQDGRVGECRYCANTGWFYGDPDLKTFCGCDFGKLREQLSSVPHQVAEPAGVMVPNGEAGLEPIWYEGTDVSEGDEIYLAPPPVDPAPSQDGVVTDEMVERLRVAYIAETGSTMWPTDAQFRSILALNKGGE